MIENKASLYPNIENKWLWIRIHKVAGTSIYDGYLINHCLNAVKNNPDGIVDAWMGKDLSDYFIWSIVRNPYDRFVSAAAMFKIDPNYFTFLFQADKVKKPMILRHTMEQHKYTHHNGISHCDFIGKIETLQNDFDYVCDRIELPRYKLPRLNTTVHGNYRKVLNRNTRNFIEEKYKLDFEYYGY